MNPPDLAYQSNALLDKRPQEKQEGNPRAAMVCKGDQQLEDTTAIQRIV
jgi:hypothetical protein